MQRLSNNTLNMIKQSVQKPQYPYADLPVGILHFGIGHFHRAHQAIYTEDAIEKYYAANNVLPTWGICGVSLRNKAAQQEIMPQNGLYSVTAKSNKTAHTRIIGCIRNVLFAPEDFTTIASYLYDPKVTVVSLTVTEKGYCHDPANGTLMLDHPDIQHDLSIWKENSFAFKTVIAYLAAGLYYRYQNEMTPFTVLSCDNLPHNGTLLRELVSAFCRLIDIRFANHVAQKVSFPNTMVDRITPMPQEKDLTAIITKLGVIDAAAIITEKYKEWVIEEQHNPLPNWQSVGAQITPDVFAYEIQKLRLLNGCHSALAYLGLLHGYEYIYETLADKNLKKYARNFLKEVTPTLPIIPERDVLEYKNQILKRFANTAIEYRCAQVAMDGSQKLPQRILNTLRDCLNEGKPYQYIVRAIAAWMQHVITQKNIVDPLAHDFACILEESNGDINLIVTNLLSIKKIFGEDLSSNEKLRQELIALLQQGLF